MVLKTVEDFKRLLDWYPGYVGYGDKATKIFYYEKSYFCKKGLIIHSSLNQVLSCNSCCKLSNKEVEECKKLIKKDIPPIAEGRHVGYNFNYTPTKEGLLNGYKKSMGRKYKP